MTTKADNKRWLYHEYIVHKKTVKEIAELSGCSRYRVEKMMKRFGIQARPVTECSPYKELTDKTWLKQKYYDEHLSANEISKLIGCGETSVYRAFDRFEITRRDNSECHVGIMTGEKNHFYGKTHTPETRKILSDKSKLCTGGKNGFYGKHHTEKTKIEISCIHQGISIDEFNGFTSRNKWCHKFNSKYKEHIRNMFDRKCFLCSKTEKEQMADQTKRGKAAKKLSVHHVNEDKEAGCNGNDLICVPLCNRCHGKISGKKSEYYQDLIMSRLAERGLLRVRQAELPLLMLEPPIASSS